MSYPPCSAVAVSTDGFHASLNHRRFALAVILRIGINQGSTVTYLSVKNLDRYQHYKHRNPPWVKLYRETWTDYTLRQHSIAERLLFIGLTSLGMELENHIPYDPKYLTGRLGFAISSAMIVHLISSNLILSNLEEHVASDALAECKQGASEKNGKTLLPAEWVLSPDIILSWQKHGINPSIEFAAFKDHAKTTARRCADWDAALRNWYRKAITMKETRK